MSSRTAKLLTATTCLSFMTTVNGTTPCDQTVCQDAVETHPNMEDFEFLPEHPKFFDAEDLAIPPKPGCIAHLTID